MKRLPVHRPLILIFMGVSGCGKTTVAKLFAKKTGAVFYEGDDFHSTKSVAKMRHGIPLTDNDRKKWLLTLREMIVRSLKAGEFAALTCSALKSKYRDALQAGDPRVQFVYLTGLRAILAKRLKNRRGHFMPLSLLQSQLETLERPAEAMKFSIKKTPAAIVSGLIRTLETRVED